MEIKYRYSESSVKPPEVEYNNGYVFLHKDYEQKTYGDSSVWSYQEAELTQAQYDEYTASLMAENAIKGEKDSEKITALVEGQETGDGNQLAIMEAIADLYDLIASLNG